MVSSENTGGVSNNKNGGTGASSSSSWSVIKFLDDNVRYIKYPFFIIGCGGVFLIARSIRLGRKFTSAGTIPREFYAKNFTLYGRVEQVKKFDGGEQSIVLFVDHAPILARKRRSSSLPQEPSYLINNCLQLTVPGVLLKSKYFPELHNKLMAQKVAFTLLEKDENMNSASCLVFVRTIKFMIIPRYENIAFWCVQNGFATTSAIPFPSELRGSKKFSQYYEKLLKLESKAVQKRKGIWDEENPSKFWIVKILKWFLQMWRERNR